MNCRDFERIWNERIDASSSPPGDLGTRTSPAADELALLEHAAGCSKCRPRMAGYQALERSILAWGPPPAPPADLADRILVAARAQSPSGPQAARTWRPGRRSIRFLVAAASVVAIIAAGLLTRISIERARDRDRMAAITPGNSRGPSPDRSDGSRLNEALASATEASWDLARSASEPAARLSRQFLDAATDAGPLQPHEPSGAVSVPSLDAFAPDSAAAVATIQQVGDRLANGVRPLSSTARHAFGFLLGPAPTKPENRANPPAARGA
jgi:hypothetical protein